MDSTDSTTERAASCPECGAELRAADANCWLCKASVPSELERRTATAPQTTTSQNSRSFSLASLFLVTTFAAVLLGVFVQAPGIGITLAIVAAPAFIRAAAIGRMWRKAGQPLTPLQAMWSFLGSVLVIATIVASTAIAFFGICFPLGAAEFNATGDSPMLKVAFVTGGLAAVAVAGFLLNELWVRVHVRWRKERVIPTAQARVVAFLQAMSVILCIATGVAIGSAALFLVLEACSPQLISKMGGETITLAVGMLAGAIGAIALIRWWFRGATWVAALSCGGIVCATLAQLAYEYGYLPGIVDPLFPGSGLLIVSALVGMTLGGAIIYRYPIPADRKAVKTGG